MQKKLLALLLALTMVVGLCACGSTSTSVSYSNSAAYEDGGASYAMKASGSGFAAYGAYDSMSAAEDYAYEPAEYEEAIEPARTPEPSQDLGSGSGDKQAEEMNDKIIYSSNVTLETTAFDDTIKSIDELLSKTGGYVESSSISSSNYSQKARGVAKARNANYTIRIPSSEFNAVMNELGSLGNVPYSHVYTENVTSQYYDAKAHMNAYKTQEARLLEMMEVAETVEDVIILEDRLTELRYRIESLQSQLNNWDRRVSYSTIYLEVQEVQEYTPEPIVNPTFGEELAKAVKNGLDNAKNLIKGLLTWLAETGPSLLIWLVIIWVIFIVVRAIYRKRAPARERRAEKKAIKKAENEEKQRVLRAKAQKALKEQRSDSKEQKIEEKKEEK